MVGLWTDKYIVGNKVGGTVRARLKQLPSKKGIKKGYFKKKVS
jgi:hypothetical protein